MANTLTIDGSQGEGGGQILRTALALSLVTGTPFKIKRIRAGRKRPGLLQQHLTAVQAAATISQAACEGATPGSLALTFRPEQIAPGTYDFRVGTAGSACLVLQTVLPALVVAAQPATLRLEGGTHNPAAPPFEALDRAFLPLLRRMGARVEATLERPGFFPRGGGRFTVRITPTPRLARLDLEERGEILARRIRAIVARLPRSIAQRELDEVRRLVTWPRAHYSVEDLEDAIGPGNVLEIEIESAGVTEVFTGFGRKGVPAEKVARLVVEEALAYETADVPVGQHLADQLLLPMALAGCGSFRTMPLTRHATTNIAIIRAFLDVEFRTWPSRQGSVRVEVGL
ncbi:MAG: RNA 3'-terminal phosphate cyclase [Planctomycetota bacterium]